jgi:hypothetical protein
VKYKLYGKLLQGKRFSSLTVLEWVAEKTRWLCRCDCGKEVHVNTTDLETMGTYRCECFFKKTLDAKYLPLVGKRFAKLLCTKYEYNKGGKATLTCTCDCGKTRIMKALQWGKVKSCGCAARDKFYNPHPLVDLTGQVFTHLTAKSYSKEKQKWLCVCKCGKEKYMKSGELKNGNNKSCGCLRLERAFAEAKALIGKKYFYLTCLDFNHDKKKGKIFLRCRCRCKNIYFLDKGKWGNTKSCGCLPGEIQGERSYAAKLTNKQAELIRKLYRSKSGFNLTVLSNMFDVTINVISRIVKDKSYKVPE